jgi:hypothetical protein
MQIQERIDGMSEHTDTERLQWLLGFFKVEYAWEGLGLPIVNIRAIDLENALTWPGNGPRVKAGASIVGQIDAAIDAERREI